MVTIKACATAINARFLPRRGSADEADGQGRVRGRFVEGGSQSSPTEPAVDRPNNENCTELRCLESAHYLQQKGGESRVAKPGNDVIGEGISRSKGCPEQPFRVEKENIANLQDIPELSHRNLYNDSFRRGSHTHIQTSLAHKSGVSERPSFQTPNAKRPSSHLLWNTPGPLP